MRPEKVQRSRIVGALAIFAGILIGFFGFFAVAQTPWAQEMPGTQDAPAAALIGVGAFSIEGAEVGKVSAVSVGRDGRISEIRITTAARLGLGERTVAVKQDDFIALTGAVVVDLFADEVDALPVQTVMRGTLA
jgi:hypothetical protein